MSSLSKVDPSTLGWVKTEIDETLKQARLALETYAGNTADDSQLRFCATYLHQVLGTLQMVELDGAALIAQETEQLASALLNKQVEPGAAIIETLSRGILVLPDYLARLQIGQPDAPLRQLALINELRAARGEAPLNAFDLFRPDLDVRPPKHEGAVRLPEPEYAETTRKLRPAFQAVLLNWLRDTGTRRFLDELSGLIERLQHEAPSALVEQAFWVARGYLDALAQGAVAINNDRKRLLARLEQLLKKIVLGDRSLIRNSSEAMIKAMLFELGQAHAATSRAAELRRAFSLAALVPGGDEDFGLPTPEALKSVSEALGQEISQAQDLVSTYFEQGDAATLEPLITLLHRMSGTLEMLGVDLLKALVDEIAGLCQQLQRGELERSETLSLPMASALLQLENSTQGMQQLDLSWKQHIEEIIAGLQQLRAGDTGIELSESTLTDTEFKQLVAAVGEEVRVNLGKIEEALETFAADPAQGSLLDPAPQYLSQIQGALQILGQDHAADMVANTQNLVQDLRTGTLHADSAVLDALAVAVGTIAAYIEGLELDRPNLQSILSVAKRDLATALTGKRPLSGNPEALLTDIDRHLTAWLADPSDRAALNSVTQDLRDLTWIARSQSQERIETLGTQMISLLEMAETDEITPDMEETLRRSHAALEQLARGQLREQPLAVSAPRPSSRAKAQAAIAQPYVPEPVPAASPTPVSTPKPAVSSASAPRKPTPPPVELDGDEDIIQIFIEDAREMIALIDKTLPAWQADTNNRDVLLDLRRAFHTLKGSGRMVGASDISEFAWAVENMLNRVREGKIGPSAPMFELLNAAHAVLPEMVVQLEGGPAPQTDVMRLRAVADALAEGQEAPAAPEGMPADTAPTEVEYASPVPVEYEAPAAVPAPSPAPTAEVEDTELPQLDPTLLQIFTGETRGHVANVRTEIEKCHEGGLGHVTESLVRAVHTLQGTARAVGLPFMAGASGETERLLHTRQAHTQALAESDLALLDRLTAAVETLIDQLNRGQTHAPELLREFAAINHAAHEAQLQVAGGTPAAMPVAPVKPAPAPAPRPALSAAVAPVTPAAAVSASNDEIVNETLDPELTEIFLEEAVDILAAVEESLARWRGNHADTGALGELKRQLHTLKGGARMSGAMTMGNLGHQTESLLNDIESGRIAADATVFDLMDEVHDALVAMIQQMLDGKPVKSYRGVLNKVLARMGQAPAPAPAAAMESEPVESPVMLPEVEPMPAAPLPEAAAPEVDDTEAFLAETRARPEGTEAGSDRREQIRVRTALLNELVNYAGEVSISRARMEQQIFGLRENLAELNRNTTRFRDQVRELEIQSESQMLARAQTEVARAGEDFDPLELDRFSRLQTLSRSLAESLHDLFTIRGNLENYASLAEGVLQQQARINTDLQEGLMRTRMVGFASQGGRLRHIVRQTAREVGKRVDMDIIGGEVEVDRTVLERMIGPFEHMIRNAIDHGIESEAERRRAGKPANGKITLSAAHEGSEIVLRFADDGAGLNIAAIRKKAIERGMMKANANLSDDELIQFILMPGFSTAGKVTQLSGRGVGMDVVHSEVKQLGGSITVDTRKGQGSTFIIRLPLTLSIAQALMVRVGEQLFALPISAVVNILEVPLEQLNNVHMGARPLLNWNDQVYPFMHLGVRLGIPTPPPEGRKVPVLLARSGGRQVAIQIDGLAGTREIVIKPLGQQLAGIEGLSGATILGDGRVVLILDVPGLWLTEEGLQVTHAAPLVETEELEALPVAEVVEATPAAPLRDRAIVMVVDDSITVRKVTQRHLSKRGIDVLLAKDGVDAMEQLREAVPDLMLVDIEMPRMDGYELTQHVRSDSRTREVPIIMITSRAGDKHRDKAFAMGVNMYMTKPYQEDVLFDNIRSLLPSHLITR
jgi:chemosensory pili system protein ChpA (sensor histidine kinase/response regulator)